MRQLFHELQRRNVYKVAGTYAAVAFLVVLSSCAQEPVPPGDRVLATDTSGGWVNVDFLAVEDPLAEAKRCVGARPDAEAVACYAFSSRSSYQASEPSAAGNFENPCWCARWSRNKLGSESGGESSYMLAACPDRAQVDDDESTGQ